MHTELIGGDFVLRTLLCSLGEAAGRGWRGTGHHPAAASRAQGTLPPCSWHGVGFLAREASLCQQHWGAVTPSSYWDAPARGWLCRSMGHQRTGSRERNW